MTAVMFGLAVIAAVVILLGYSIHRVERGHLGRTSRRITPAETGGQPWWPWTRA